MAGKYPSYPEGRSIHCSACGMAPLPHLSCPLSSYRRHSLSFVIFSATRLYRAVAAVFVIQGLQHRLTDGQGQHFSIFFQPRRGGTCPEPIPILYIVPGPSSSSELAVLPHKLSPPTTPYTSRAASRPSDKNSMYL